MDACHEELRDREVSLRVSLPARPAELVADRARLIQVICNLVGNAAKYTPSGGKIDLTVTVKENTLELSVKDNGIGIPAGRLTEIFDLFAQVDRSGERGGGLGIGLTLVRQIAMLHGGNIEARSEGVGRGSEFLLTLPIVPVPQGVAVHAPPAESVSAPRRILVVDDNRDAVESLVILLELSGHEVHKALDGASAITIAEAVRPEVVLLDLGMPNVSGYDVARYIREQPWGQPAYLVALSGWGQAEDRLRTQAAGFDAHLVKPVAPETLNRLLGAMRSRASEPTAPAV